MSKNTEETDIQDIRRAIETLADNYKENIKDAHRALRSSTTADDRNLYRKVITHNRAELREARNKLKILKARTGKSWWLWLAALIGCVFLLMFAPGASLAVVLAPLWILGLFGIVGLLFFLRR